MMILLKGVRGQGKKACQLDFKGKVIEKFLKFFILMQINISTVIIIIYIFHKTVVTKNAFSRII